MLTDNVFISHEKLQLENIELKEEVEYLEKENNKLKYFLEKNFRICKYISWFSQGQIKETGKKLYR